ncbi:MAG: TCR/Tet family MFS transporter [Saprospiraceae bacterium]|nr:TCR/Tet family MFS transporter [Saprospiraceae bacterium]
MRMKRRKAALGFIFITLLIDVTGFGLIIPVMPEFIMELTGADVSTASRYGGWLLFSYAIMQFLFAPVLGNLSDRFGRRPVLLLSLLGFSVDYLVQGFAPTIVWLFIGRIVAGICGSSFTTASAYIADVSPPEERAKNFGLIGVAFGLGFILGPMLGGFLGEWGIRVPFFVAAGLALANAAYGYFILPESLPPEDRRPFELRRANPVGSLLHLRKYPAVKGLIATLVLVYIAAHAVQSNWTYFAKEVFDWSEWMIGLSLGVVGLLVGAVQGGLIRVVNPWLGNANCIYVGLLLYSLGMFLFAFAVESWMMFAFLVPYCLGGIAGPALQATISNQVPGNEQGELQGALTSLISVTSIIGPPLMTNLFAWFTDGTVDLYFPGVSFFLGGLLMLASAFFAWQTLRGRQLAS